VHGVVDTFGVTLREIVVASKVVGRILTGHAPSLPLPNFSFSRCAPERPVLVQTSTYETGRL
jgi:hypothetical protein